MRSGIDRYNNKVFALKIMPKYTKDTGPGIVERTCEFYRKAGFKRDLMISEPGMQAILDFTSGTTGSEESHPWTIFRRSFRAPTEQREIAH